MKQKVITYLLSNEHFIRWVKHPNRNLEVFWEKWKEAHPDCHNELEHARLIISQTRFPQTEVNKESFDRILTRILAQDSKSETRANSKKGRWIYIYPIAASIALFMVLGGILWVKTPGHSITTQELLNFNKITKTTPKGQKLSFSLPDRTYVNLNAGSSLTFDESYTNREIREANLRGEAFFDVRQNLHKPFKIHAGACTVTALGTSFSIRAFDEESTTTVSLTEGKVMVEINGVDIKNNGLKTFYLEPNQKLEFDKATGICRIKQFNPEEEISWITGVLTFNKSNLYQVVRTLEFWYGVEVVISGLPDENWNLTGKFNNQSLEMVMESIAYTEGIDYTLENEKLIIQF